MSEKHIVVQGATCKCKFSVEPKVDKLKVKSQTKHFANDKDGSKKLIASDKDIGQTLEKNTFGKCKKQPAGNDYLPCQAVITKWSGFYKKITLSNKGKVLLEDSKGTCPMGAPDCIEFTKHGQITEASKQNIKNANPDVQNKINPLLNLKGMEKPKLKHTGMEQASGQGNKTEFVVFVIQGVGTNPENGKERAKDDKYSAVDYEGLGKLTNLNSEQTKVYVYSSSRTENTKNAVLKMIKDFRSKDGKVKIIMVGHSMGADNIIELTKENPNITFDFIITLDIKDAASSGTFSVDDDNINTNVKNAINYYQEGERIGNEQIEIENSKFTKGVNILSPGSNHRSIDNDLKDYLIEDCKNYINGKDAVKLAKSRKLPTFDPAKSNSKKISYNNYNYGENIA